MKESEQFTYIIWICVATVLILIFYSLAATYYVSARLCAVDTDTYCFLDWKCYDVSTGEELNMAEKYYLNGACDPITEQTLHKFPYTNIDGIFKTGDPGNEKNVWADSCKNDKSDVNCPNYVVGTIYWKACHGIRGTPYCTSDTGKCNDF